MRILILILLVFATSVFAKPLYIEITGGKNIGVPIVVLPFEQQKADDPIENAVSIEDISAIIRNDLQSSGQFRALDISNLQKQYNFEETIDSGYWKNYGSEFVLLGKTIPKGAGVYDVTFKLIDIYKDPKSPVLSYVFRDKSLDDFRPLGHFISDLVFKQITGVAGFFSTRIAYITVDRAGKNSVHTLTVADADGVNDKPLLAATYPLMSPRWSPDGNKLAFVSFKDKRSSIKIVDVRDGFVEDLTNYPGINGAPAWSPDGKHLALVLSKDGAPKLYVIDLNNKKLRRITNGGSIDTEPFWHPDGQSLFFTSNRGGKPQIYQVILQTGKVDRVTFRGDYNATPSVTPDGKKLVMLHRSEDGGYNIAIQDLDSGRLKILTHAQLNESPSIAPNGMMVLYGMRDGGDNILGAVTLDGRFKLKLPVQDGNVKEPAWSPFLVKY